MYNNVTCCLYIFDTNTFQTEQNVNLKKKKKKNTTKCFYIYSDAADGAAIFIFIYSFLNNST